jgi:DNA modification methylase
MIDLVDLIKTHTYQEVSDQTGLSIGAIHRRLDKAGYYARRREERRRRILDAVTNKVVKGDVLDFVENLPDNCAQLVCSSPPYAIRKPYGDNRASDSMHPLRFFGWLCEIVAEIERILAPGGVVALVVGATRDRHGVLMPMDWLLKSAFEQTALTYQNRIAWIADHGLQPKRRLAERYETIVVYSKGEPIFNPNSARTPQRHIDKRAYKGPRKGQLTSHVLGAWPTDVWSDIPHLRHNAGEKTAHPCQFPVDLAKRLIMLYSKPGQLVADLFRGSGTTHVAAVQCGRNFVGSDLHYEDIAEKRVSAATADTFTPFSGVTPESADFWARELNGDPTKARATRVDGVAAPIDDAADRALCLELFPDFGDTAA